MKSSEKLRGKGSASRHRLDAVIAATVEHV